MQWIEFLNRFVRTPRQVGSVTPSSVFLARTIVGSVPWERCEVIVELGAGTGVITRAIQAQRRSGSRFHVFEVDPEFRQTLTRELPDASVHGDAMDLASVLGTAGDAEADAIISCLPLTLMREEERLRLFASIGSVMAPDGIFVAFQYTPLLVPVLKRHFRTVEMRFAPLNVPPAFVYSCEQPVMGEYAEVEVVR